MTDLFEDELAACAANLVTIQEDRKVQRAVSAHRRREVRRAKSEANLAEVWPENMADGMSHHFISQGDVDSLSYLAMILRTHRIDYLLFSTWCMAMDDVAQIERWLIEGRIGKVDGYCGEIFPNQYPDEHRVLCDVLRAWGGRVCIFRTHAKIFAGFGELDFAIESSANINTNPRAEQTAVHIGRELPEFYKSFYDGTRSFNRDFDDWQPTVLESAASC